MPSLHEKRIQTARALKSMRLLLLGGALTGTGTGMAAAGLAVPDCVWALPLSLGMIAIIFGLACRQRSTMTEPTSVKLRFD